MIVATKIGLFVMLTFFLLVAALDTWGFLTQGSIEPDLNQSRNEQANKVVMVFGATGSAGDGLLKAAIEDPEVKKVYVITRRSSERIDSGVASGKVDMRIHKDFTDYSNLADELTQVNTVLWGLGTSSLQVDEATYTRIHVDFPKAFVQAWLSAKNKNPIKSGNENSEFINLGPMSFHFIAGMGTDGSAQWAKDKRQTETGLAALANNTSLRTFSYRSAYIRPTSEQANIIHYIGDALLRPGSLVISSKELGGAMLEISARVNELDNGSLIDNGDSLAYAKLYKQHWQQ
jgi:hypothetical protein